MQYQVGLAAAFGQNPFARLTAESPFPAFAVGQLIQFPGQPVFQITGILHMFPPDAANQLSSATLLIVTQPHAFVSDDFTPWPW